MLFIFLNLKNTLYTRFFFLIVTMRFRCIFRFLLGDKIREMRSERKKVRKNQQKCTDEEK